MQKDIHPKYSDTTKAICACGAVYLVGSTIPEIHIEICGSCHPFFSGNEKVMDTAGRIDRFNNRKAATLKKKSK